MIAGPFPNEGIVSFLGSPVQKAGSAASTQDD